MFNIKNNMMKFTTEDHHILGGKSALLDKLGSNLGYGGDDYHPPEEDPDTKN